MLSKILRDEDYESLKYYKVNTSDQLILELVEFIKENKTFNLIEIAEGLSVKHSGLLMKMINSVERELIEDDLTDHLNYLENEVFEETKQKNWFKKIDGIFEMNIHKAFEKIEELEE